MSIENAVAVRAADGFVIYGSLNNCRVFEIRSIVVELAINLDTHVPSIRVVDTVVR